MTRYRGTSTGWLDLATGLIVTGTVPPAPGIVPPTNLSVSALGTTTLTLTWTLSTSSGITEQRVYRNGARIATLGAGATSYAVAGLTASTSYDFNVTAFNGTTNSPYSNTATATTTAVTDPPTDNSYPPVPTSGFGSSNFGSDNFGETP